MDINFRSPDHSRLTDAKVISTKDPSHFSESPRRDNIENLVSRVDQDRWDLVCGQMLVQIVNGNFEAAEETLKAFCSKPYKDSVSMDSKLSEVFPLRLANMLEKAGLMSLYEVANASDARLLVIRNFGITNLQLVRERIAELSK